MKVSNNYYGNSTKTGVYYILHVPTNKHYVGATNVKFSQRKGQHYYQLKNNRSGCIPMQEAWNSSKEEEFEFGILEIIYNSTILSDREQYWTDILKSNINGFNKRISVIDNTGISQTEEVKTRHSNTLKGRTPKNLESIREKQRRAVDEFFEGVYIRTHESGKAAGEFHNIDYKLINNVCRGIVKNMRSLPGYTFKYSDGKGVRSINYNPNSSTNGISPITIKR